MHHFNMNFVKGNPAICTTGFAGYVCKKQREQTTPNAHMSIGYNMTVASRNGAGVNTISLSTMRNEDAAAK